MKKIAYLGFICLLVCIQSQARAESTIQGQVLDAEGNPLEGARIWFAGSDLKTCSDARGKYSLPSRHHYFYTVRVLKSNFDEMQTVIIGSDKKQQADFVLNRNKLKAFKDCRTRTIRSSEPYWHADDDQPPSRPAGVITGLVIDSETAQPLAGVTVKTDPETITTTSNHIGNYTIYKNAAPDLYEVIARRPEYRPSKLSVRLSRGSDDSTPYVSANITLTAYPNGAEGGSNIGDFESDEEQINSAEGRSRYEDE